MPPTGPYVRQQPWVKLPSRWCLESNHPALNQFLNHQLQNKHHLSIHEILNTQTQDTTNKMKAVHLPAEILSVGLVRKRQETYWVKDLTMASSTNWKTLQPSMISEITVWDKDISHFGSKMPSCEHLALEENWSTLWHHPISAENAGAGVRSCQPATVFDLSAFCSPILVFRMFESRGLLTDLALLKIFVFTQTSRPALVHASSHPGDA